MVIKNKKNGTNVLAYRAGVDIVRIAIKSGEQVNILGLVDFNQIINKADFQNRGWFEIVNEKKIETKEEESSFEKAEKQVNEYTSEKKSSEKKKK